MKKAPASTTRPYRSMWLWLLPVATLLILAGCVDEPAVLAPTAAPTAMAAERTDAPGAPTAILETTATATLPPTPTLVPPTATPETTTASFAEAECPFHPGGWAVTCGYLTVPENRSQENGREIRLFVAIVHSTSDPPANDPIIFLHGGPGGQAGWYTLSIAVNFGDALAQRDLIVFDQRGAGLSEPSLDCPEWQATIYPRYGEIVPPEERRATAEGVHRACFERLAATGNDFAGYNSTASAADINDLRLALGYDQVNLFGISYGSRLALTVMRDYPHMVRSAILDSTVPLEVDMYAALPANRQRAFDMLFSHCAADAQCAAAFPELEERFYALAERLDGEPVTLQLRYEGNSQLYDVAVNGDVLIGALHWALYSTELLPHLPRYIDELERGIVTNWRDLIYSWAFIGDGFSEGASAAVWCYDEFGFSSGNQVTETLHPRQQEYAAYERAAWVDQCAVWQVAAGPAMENEPVRSGIPTLVLAGEFDPITPPQWGRQVAETLDKAHFYEFPSVSHGVRSARRCARDMVTAFLAAPDREPALDCYSQLQDTTFITR
jgi:pimeloyl-ACP methyl ester carboxylesterase